MAQDKVIREAQVIYQVGEAGARQPVALRPIANLGLHLTAHMTFADEQWSAYCPELDLTAAGDTPELALDELTHLAVEYAAEYLDEFDLYVNSSNRAAHLPHILAVAQHTVDPRDVKALEAIRQLFVVEQSWPD